MNKRLKALSCALVGIFALSIAVDSPNLGPLGADAVSASTAWVNGAPPAPAPVKAPTKTTTKTPTRTTTTTTTRTTTYTTSTGVTRLLRFNSMGGDVKLVQTSLNNKGYKLTVDGIFGKLTLAAVRDFQSKNGLVVDGLVGPATCAKLFPKPVSVAPVARLLTLGSVGADVKLLQTSLNTKGYKLSVDGFFGNLTLAAVKNYQSKNGLVVDGLVGPATLAKLKTTTVVTPPVKTPVTPPVKTPDVVTSASVVDNIATFEKSIGTDGKWIICTTKDLISTKELVLDGEFKNTKTPPVTSRKIALYTQDKDRNVLARFTLTAPKLTIKSPEARIQSGTFKGDVYVTTTNFQLVDATIVGNVYVSATNFTLSKNAKVQGNIYFATEGAKTSFKLLDTSTVTGTKDLQVIDAVSTASIVKDDVALAKAMGTEATGGKWIICALNDITTTKELVLDGSFKKAATDLVPQRKIGLYTQAKQDGVNTVTNKFTLTAPKLTIKSPEAKIQSSNFKGDLYVTTANFQLIDSTVVGNVYVSATNFKLSKNSKIQGNVYFATEGSKTSFQLLDTSSVTGTKDLQVIDAVSTASIVKDDVALEKAMGLAATGGKWIICSLNDITTTKDLVLEGEFRKAATDVNPQRKIGLYTQAKQDGVNFVTKKFTLTAPSLTIKSPYAKIQNSIFVGDIYVVAENFTLVDSNVTGNLYFATEALKAAYLANAANTGTVSGVKEVKTK